MPRPRPALIALALIAAAGASALGAGGRSLLDGLVIPQNPPARFVNSPGLLELSGRMVVRPIQASDWIASGLAPDAAAAKVAEARARLAVAFKTYPEVDEYLVKVPQGLTENQVSAVLMSTGLYQYAEPDWRCFPDKVPNDPNYSKQWQLTKLQAPAAWDITTGSDIILAITDSGLTHPDFNTVPGHNIPSNNDNTADVNGHGTFCAGMAGAKGNNGVGVVGAGWNFRIMPVRVTNNANGSAFQSDILNGGRWAVDHGARGISASFSGVTAGAVQTTGKYIKSKNGLYCYAAGNDGTKINGADWPDVIVVGATTSNDSKASFSNYGDLIDVVAPGYNVYSTVAPNSYGSGSGTSFSTPLTNGVIGMIWSANPGLSAQQVEDILFNSCKDLGTPGDDSTFGHGRVDLLNAVTLAGAAGGIDIPFLEQFDSPALNPAVWGDNTGAIVTTLATNEPSDPYSLGLIGPVSITTQKFNLKGGDPAVTVSFWSEHQYVEQGKSLKVEYYSYIFGWQTLATIVSSGIDQSSFVRTEAALPADGFSPDMRLRFTAVGVDNGDAWFVDDISASNIVCSADLNGDGALDLFDFLQYTNLFNAQDPSADWDHNGVFDLFDFLGYVNSFNGGC